MLLMNDESKIPNLFYKNLKKSNFFCFNLVFGVDDAADGVVQERVVVADSANLMEKKLNYY